MMQEKSEAMHLRFNVHVIRTHLGGGGFWVIPGTKDLNAELEVPLKCVYMSDSAVRGRG